MVSGLSTIGPARVSHGTSLCNSTIYVVNEVLLPAATLDAIPTPLLAQVRLCSWTWGIPWTRRGCVSFTAMAAVLLSFSLVYKATATPNVAGPSSTTVCVQTQQRDHGLINGEMEKEQA